MNQSAIRIAPNAAAKPPTYPQNRSPGSANIGIIKTTMRAKYEILKKDVRQFGVPMVLRHFGHGNETGRSLF
jgi:hypothetical protein